jgi:hypothetical protein
MNVRELLRALIDGRVYNALPCKVESVDGCYCDVTPVDDSLAAIKKVRLNGSIGVAGLVVTPKTGSVVLVVMIDEFDSFVGMFSEIEKVKFMDVNGFELEIDKGIMSVKNKNYSLRQAFDDIIAAVEKLTVPTGTGPSGTPVNISEFKTVGTKLDNFLK